ncbi:MAG: iron ABC transporter permease [Planctomycetes bacterium]|nr:iron ABC transporter permease [Planctomycetota bacterium]
MIDVPRRMPPALLAGFLVLALTACALGSLNVGTSDLLGFRDLARGCLATVGLAEPLESRGLQTIAELRLWRVLVSIGVGAALALSGGLLQGVFRNHLASPSVLGVTSGASLGASLAIMLVASGGSFMLIDRVGGAAPALITTAAFAAAMGVTLLITMIATTGGRVSIPTLLLVGIALNAMIGGALAALQAWALDDSDLTRSMITWTFGRLDDRSAWHVGVVWIGLALACVAIPFTAFELDLFAAGEEDARGLGVDTRRVKLIALAAASLAAAVAVSVCGQIAFVGLVVPHVLRLLSGPSHRSLLPLCLLGGPVLVLGADLAQRVLLGANYLPPGVIMSIVGGPFFLYLLLRNRRSLEAW